MKKKFIYSMLVLAGVALSACNEDFKDWSDPQVVPQPDAISVSFSATPAGAMNIATTTTDSVTLFTPSITVNRSNVETTYDAVVYNAGKTDSVIVKCDSKGRALTSAVQGAFLALYGPESVARTAPMNLVARSMVEGTAVFTRCDGLTLTVTPKYQELPDPWYIIGNCIGRGTWVNNVLVKYTNLVAMHVNPYNYDELVYASYFQDNAEFRVILEVGNKQKFIGQDASGNIQYTEDGDPGLSNITIATGGYYQITVNVEKKTLAITPINKGVVTWDAMAAAGAASVNLNKVTTAPGGENHDWQAVVNVDNSGAGIRIQASEQAFWGGTAFPAGKAAKGAGNIPATPGKYRLVFNDILNTYRFIPE